MSGELRHRHRLPYGGPFELRDNKERIYASYELNDDRTSISVSEVEMVALIPGENETESDDDQKSFAVTQRPLSSYLIENRPMKEWSLNMLREYYVRCYAQIGTKEHFSQVEKLDKDCEEYARQWLLMQKKTELMNAVAEKVTKNLTGETRTWISSLESLNIPAFRWEEAKDALSIFTDADRIMMTYVFGKIVSWEGPWTAAGLAMWEKVAPRIPRNTNDDNNVFWTQWYFQLPEEHIHPVQRICAGYDRIIYECTLRGNLKNGWFGADYLYNTYVYLSPIVKKRLYEAILYYARCAGPDTAVGTASTTRNNETAYSGPADNNPYAKRIHIPMEYLLIRYPQIFIDNIFDHIEWILDIMSKPSENVFPKGFSNVCSSKTITITHLSLFHLVAEKSKEIRPVDEHNVVFTWVLNLLVVYIQNNKSRVPSKTDREVALNFVNSFRNSIRLSALPNDTVQCEEILEAVIQYQDYEPPNQDYIFKHASIPCIRVFMKNSPSFLNALARLSDYDAVQIAMHRHRDVASFMKLVYEANPKHEIFKCKHRQIVEFHGCNRCYHCDGCRNVYNEIRKFSRSSKSCSVQ